MTILFFKSTIFLTFLSLLTIPALAAPVTTTTKLSNLLRGFDVSQPQSTDFLLCAKKAGYEKIIIRAYQQACGVVRLFHSSHVSHIIQALIYAE